MNGFGEMQEEALKMEITENTSIRVETTVKAPLEKVWELWTNPEHIKNWNNASAEWHTPSAENDLRPGGEFAYRMEAKDGSLGFDFRGVYDAIENKKSITYTIDDGRKVKVKFTNSNAEIKIVETFEPENTNSLEMQRAGWQAILDNFKRYTEAN
jgi:uncharacterized protein YndB with AHSA1/START domain